MEPKAVVTKRWICPGCDFESKKKYVLTEHLKKCWRNPENKACDTCEHYNIKWRGGKNLSTCDVGLKIYGRPNANCRRWETRVTVRTPDVDYLVDFKNKYTRVDVVKNGAMK